MNKTAQLIVNFDKKNTSLVLKLMPAMVVAMAVGLFYFSNANIFFPGAPFLNFLVSAVIKTFLCFGIGLFLIGTIVAFFVARYKGAAAILDQNGIWIRHYNFIPWKNIEEFAPYMVGGKLEAIGIQVKDPKILFKQSNLGGKIGIFWTKLFGTPHITLSNLDTENETIIVFAHRYLKQ